MRHYHVELAEKDISKNLKNLILKEFKPNKVIVQKINVELGFKVCATFRPFLNLKDIPVIIKPNEEQIHTKVTLNPNKNGFWDMSVEHILQKKEAPGLRTPHVMTYTSAKPVKDLKDSEVVKWVSANLLVLTKK